MNLVTIAIGKSLFTIPCKEAEADKMIALSKKLNQRVNELAISLKNVDEKTLLVIAAIMAEEKIEEGAKNKSEENEEDLFNEDDMQDAISENIENITDYIQKLANKIKNL